MRIELSGHYGYWRIVKTMTPMVLMMVVTSVYSIVDGLFISNFAGSDAFAGMNIIWPAIGLLGALGLMIGSGGSALVSKTFGEGDPQKANRIFSMLVWLCVVSGIAMAVAACIWMPWISARLGADEVLLPHACSYGRILVVALPCFMLQMAFQPFYMVAERPELGTLMSIVCGLANIALDALFVAGFGWGLTGAAIATAVSFVIGGVFPICYFSSKRNKTQLKLVHCKPEGTYLTKACTNGLSEFVGNVAVNVIAMCYNLQLMKYIGPDGVSAFGIIVYLGFTFGAVFIGYNMGISQVISYNYGADDKVELRSLLNKSLALVAICGVAMTALAETTSSFIARCFVGYDRSICDLTVHATRIYMLSFLICGFNMFASAWFTALNNGVVSAVSAFARTLVFEMAAVFVLPSLLGIEGIWMSVNVAELLTLILSICLILGFRKRYGY